MMSTSTNVDRLNSYLVNFPRTQLANTPTPLEKMPRLSENINGPVYFALNETI